MGAKNKTIKYLSYCYLLLITLASCRSQETQEANGNPKLSFEHVIIDSNNPPNPHCKTVGDINGDDLPDILAASDQGDTTGLFWYEYPNWTKYKISGGSFTTDMQVGDIDNDGDLDVIIPKGADPSNTVWWYENPRPNGMPSEDPWIEHKIIDAGAHDVELADMNRDGMLDVVIRLGNVSVLLQGLNDSWINIPINTGGHTGSSLEDINGDGRIDIILDGYWLEAPIDLIQGEWERHKFADGWEGKDVGVTPADLNNDNRPDIIIAPSESEGQLIWYEAPADPTNEDQWVAHTIDSTVSYIHTFKVADMDLDGDIDIITAEMHQSETRRVSVYLNAGNSLNWEPLIVATTGSHNLRIADIDNDGDMDIVGANWNNDSPTNGAIELWRNNLRN